jgi:hypothetical protein
VTDDEFAKKKKFYDGNQFHWNGSKGRARGMRRMRQEYQDAEYIRRWCDEALGETHRDVALAREGDVKAQARMRSRKTMREAWRHVPDFASPEVRVVMEENAVAEEALVDEYFEGER